MSETLLEQNVMDFFERMKFRDWFKRTHPELYEATLRDRCGKGKYLHERVQRDHPHIWVERRMVR